MSEITYAYFGGLEKSRDDKGYLNVKGLATDDTLDLDEQICDPQWLKTACQSGLRLATSVSNTTDQRQ